MHTCARAHDYAHVHAIKIFHTCVQKHMLTTKCTRTRMSRCTHVCTHRHICMLSLPLISHMHVLLSCHTQRSIFKLQLTLSRLSIGPHRNQTNNSPQQNAQKTLTKSKKWRRELFKYLSVHKLNWKRTS